MPVDAGPPRGAVTFRMPVEDPTQFDRVIGVDHDPTVYDDGALGIHCLDYQAREDFPFCYDEHDGSDYLLSGGFDAMDAGSTPIVAGADGVVVATEDGNYDRCHATSSGVDCDGYEMEPNYVAIEHVEGYVSYSFHMKSGSVAVAVGDEVACGDAIGLVGSSGYSSLPHVHFELQDEDGATVDPYAGSESQPETFWVDQRDSAVEGGESFPGAACAG